LDKGGGSGGLACAKETWKLGYKVAVADFVKPSPLGTKWGIGGTCLNVGCIPKKLMHYAAMIGETRHFMKSTGWTVDEKLEHNWSAMVSSTSKHIKSSNYEIKVDLIEKGIKNFNCFGSIDGPNRVKVILFLATL
jgi:thioredoxin reductase (NADPH)